MVEDTCIHLGRTLESFKQDVNAAIKEVELTPRLASVYHDRLDFGRTKAT
jgi:hypothetical protein